MADEPATREDEVVHTPLVPFARGAVRELATGPGRKPRMWLRGLGVVLAFVLAPLLLLDLDTGYRLRCEPSQQSCTLTTHHVFAEETTTFAFGDVEKSQFHTTGQVEVQGSTGEYEPSGLWVFYVDLKSGASLRASTGSAAPPQDLNRLYDMVRGQDGPPIDVVTTASWNEVWILPAAFVFGLFVIALAGWRTVASLDTSSGVLTLERRWRPLPGKLLLRVDARDVDKVITRQDKAGFSEKWWVDVSLDDSTKHSLGPYGENLTASRLGALLRRLLQDVDSGEVRA